MVKESSFCGPLPTKKFCVGRKEEIQISACVLNQVTHFRKVVPFAKNRDVGLIAAKFFSSTSNRNLMACLLIVRFHSPDVSSTVDEPSEVEGKNVS